MVEKFGKLQREHFSVRTSATVAASADDPAPDAVPPAGEYVLTVDVTARRPSNGAEGVTTMSIPLIVSNETPSDPDDDGVYDDHSGGGCDAMNMNFLGATLALVALAFIAHKDKR